MRLLIGPTKPAIVTVVRAREGANMRSVERGATFRHLNGWRAMKLKQCLWFGEMSPSGVAWMPWRSRWSASGRDSGS